MFPPFDEKKAHEVCLKIKSFLEKGEMKLITPGMKSEERSSQGIMLGALVCRNAENKIVNLIAVSGVSKNLILTSLLKADKGNQVLCEENSAAENRFYLSENNSYKQIDSGNEDDLKTETVDGTENVLTEYVIVPAIVSAEKINEALKQNDAEIHLLTEKINSLKEKNENVSELKKQRTELCNASLKKVYDLYSFHCIDGKVRSLNSICAEKLHGALPPTGTGECCAPKLLDYAYSHSLIPESMCEIYYGNSSDSLKKISGNKYDPCNERCGIILPFMLGLEVLYRDKDIVVVNKQSGVLSVPGRGPDKQDCIVNRVRSLYPECMQQPSVHRLDMETSGLLVLAFNDDAHRKLCRQFEDGLVQKHYIALLDGVLAEKNIPKHGQNELYFRLDVDNRPHQIWDDVYGKKAITEWQILDVEKYHAPDGKVSNATRVRFFPHTGRTHQLRLASADAHGFGVPIIGDTLYGKCKEGERLMLHAEYISFTHPVTGEKMEFNCPPEF